MKFCKEADVFPLLEKDELRALAADIDTHGQLETIKRFEGKILDGRNRYLAIIQHCKKVTTPKFEDVSPDSPIAYVISENLRRRHLTTGQRAIAIVKALPIFEAEAAKRRKATVGRPPKFSKSKADLSAISEDGKGRARDEAAKLAGVSPRAVQQAKLITNDGDEVVKNAVQDGSLSLDRAEKIVKSTPDKKKQAEKVKAAQTSKQATRVKSLTGEVEWYTPEEYVRSAERAMGSIDLDPASCLDANKSVRAATFFDLEADGLSKDWAGNVFLNPPYRMPLVKDFTSRLVEMVTAKKVVQAVLLVNNATDTEWFHHCLQHCTAVCFTRGRINFIQVVDGEAETRVNPTNGQCFFYFGRALKRFRSEFEQYGAIVARV